MVADRNRRTARYWYCPDPYLQLLARHMNQSIKPHGTHSSSSKGHMNKGPIHIQNGI
ncbi:unnamed protein product [Amoebophrya sp. A25]|nr:unnamed protein product [Amoebophrya sp. A25]|eukprot:GSA25T00020787001.1